MPTVTLAELQQYTWDLLEYNQILYTAQQVTNTINESWRIVNAFCGCQQATVSVPGFSVASQILYTVPSPILFPMVVYFEGKKLLKMSFGGLAGTYRGWATSPTTKSGPVRAWAPFGITQFVIFPFDALGGRDISMTGVVEPTPLVNAGDVIQVEDEYVTMIIELTAHRLQLKEGGRVFANSSSTMLNSFFKHLNDRKMFTSFKSPTYRILVGMPSQ